MSHLGGGMNNGHQSIYPSDPSPPVSSTNMSHSQLASANMSNRLKNSNSNNNTTMNTTTSSLSSGNNNLFNMNNNNGSSYNRGDDIVVMNNNNESYIMIQNSNSSSTVPPLHTTNINHNNRPSSPFNKSFASRNSQQQKRKSIIVVVLLTLSIMMTLSYFVWKYVQHQRQQQQQQFTVAHPVDNNGNNIINNNLNINGNNNNNNNNNNNHIETRTRVNPIIQNDPIPINHDKKMTTSTTTPTTTNTANTIQQQQQQQPIVDTTTTTTTTTNNNNNHNNNNAIDQTKLHQWYQKHKIDPSTIIESMIPHVHMRFMDDEQSQSLSPTSPSQSSSPTSPTSSHVTRHHIRQSMLHAYHNYEQYAWGSDELKPLSQSSHNWAKNSNNEHRSPRHYRMALTMIDSLDTLFLMGMSNEFNRALEYLNSDSFAQCHTLDWDGSVFETTIRVVGGLLSAYELAIGTTTTSTSTSTSSGTTVSPMVIQNLLHRAQEYADCLMPAFSTSSGIPYSSINFKTHQTKNYPWNHMSSILSEFGSVQLEFRKLSQLTSQSSYDDAVTRVMNVMKRHEPNDGLYPVMFHPEELQWTGDVQAKLGALGDSYYEYLLKQYLLTRKSEPMYRDMYNRALTGIMNRLTFVYDSDNNGNDGGDGGDGDDSQVSSSSLKNDMTVFIAELISGQNNYKEDHLVCFISGMIALGEYHHVHEHRSSEAPSMTSSTSTATCPFYSTLFHKYASLFKLKSDDSKEQSLVNNRALPLGAKNGDRYVNPMIQLAHGIVNGCYKTYRMSKTGLGPETFRFDPDSGKVSLDAKHYILRPETVESLFIMYRVTKNNEYRDMAWNIYDSIEKHCKTEHGYSGIRNVDQIPVVHDDMQQSFFLAETLKYLFLTFVDDDSIVSLDEFVFNTEAHPLRMMPARAKETK